MGSRAYIALLLSGVVCLALAACGGDDEESDEDQVIAAIEQAATSTDPASCTDVVTQNFVEQTEFAQGEEAVEACEEDADDAVESVEVSEVELGDTTATANAAITDDGPYDGQTLELSLVKEGEQWKVDLFESFVVFDREAFLSGLEADSVAEGDLDERQAACFVDALDQGTDEELEDLFLSGDPTILNQILTGCGVRG